ncbi:MAG: 2-hydroxyglutaryl-CoA dehydratase, partial [Firmicutes bacterium]|nr:2-hydroxyglutaryl-CoA dehydratase [Bacillota bacterium]
LMGAYGAAILAMQAKTKSDVPFSFDVADMDFVTREVNCGKCSNNCEIICVSRDGVLIDSWGNRCERGDIRSKVNK